MVFKEVSFQLLMEATALQHTMIQSLNLGLKIPSCTWFLTLPLSGTNKLETTTLSKRRVYSQGSQIQSATACQFKQVTVNNENEGEWLELDNITDVK